MKEATRTVGGALVLDGNALRDQIVAQVRREVGELSSVPCLATVLIGDDGPSQVYVRNKHRQAQLAGMTSRNETLPHDASQHDAEALVRQLASDPAVSGIIVQQPVPGHLDGEKLLALIPVEKDVDGLTTASMGRLMRGVDSLVPCTPLGAALVAALRRANCGQACSGSWSFAFGGLATCGVAGAQRHRRHRHVGSQSHRRLGGRMPCCRHSYFGNWSGSQHWHRTRKARRLGD